MQGSQLVLNKVGDGEDTVLLDLLAGGEDLPDEQIEWIV